MADLQQWIKINFKSDFGWNINTCWKDYWTTTCNRVCGLGVIKECIRVLAWTPYFRIINQCQHPK
jgi:hypothetical protein